MLEGHEVSFLLRSSEGLGKLFRTLFPDSKLVSKFSLGKMKCVYMKILLFSTLFP